MSGSRRALVASAWVLSVVLTAFVAIAATRSTLAPDIDSVAEVRVPTVEVIHGSLGRTVDLPAYASWSTADLGFAATGGVITSLSVGPGDLVDAGTTIFTVNLRPVVVARGAVPAFRDLTEGTTGPDVSQLQDLLKAGGYFKGTADGTFGSATTRSVKAWQKSLKIDATGSVLAGDIIYVPEVPLRFLPADGVQVGSQVQPGQLVVRSVASTPAIRAVVSASQNGLVPLEGAVTVEYGGQAWPGVVSEAVSEESGDVSLIITAEDGSAVCGSECIVNIPVDDQAREVLMQVRMEVVPETSGTVVPKAALGTLANGQTVLTEEGGRQLPVEVVVSADGQAIVTGIEPGTRVLLYGTDG